MESNLSDAITSSQSGPESIGNEEGTPHSPNSGITRLSPLDCLVSYHEHSLMGESYPSAEMQSLYS